VVEYDRDILPGQEGKISLVIKERKSAGQFTKNIKVRSNAAGHQEEILKLTAFFYKLLEIKPRESVYVSGFQGEPFSTRLTLTSNHDEVINIKGMEIDNPDVTAVLKKDGEPVEELALNKEETAELHIETAADIPIGRIKALVTLLTDSEEIKNPVITLRGVIRHHIMVSPSHIRFSFFGPDQVIREREVNIHEKGNRTFSIKDITSTDPKVVTDLTTVTEGKHYKLVVKYDGPPEEEGTQRGMIVIETDDEKMPEVKLPFSVTRREPTRRGEAFEQPSSTAPEGMEDTYRTRSQSSKRDES
jgi:hypothetical protein